MDFSVNVWAVLLATVVYCWRRAVFALAVLLGNSALSGTGGGAALGALVRIGIWFALMSVTFMYESRRPALFLIDGGYHVLALTAADAILGAWPAG